MVLSRWLRVSTRRLWFSAAPLGLQPDDLGFVGSGPLEHRFDAIGNLVEAQEIQQSAAVVVMATSLRVRVGAGEASSQVSPMRPLGSADERE